jgi:hypothetical protein
MVLAHRENERTTRHRILFAAAPAHAVRRSLPHTATFLRKLLGELGGETDQLSDGGCAVDVYGMHRPHQVVGSHDELLGDRELTTLAALQADLAVVDIAELATHRRRRGGCRGTQPM